MANIKSAKKRVLIAEARRVKNAAARSKIRTAIKKYEASLLEASNKEETQALLVAAISLLDKAAQSNLMHRNAVARKKSRMVLKFNKTYAA
ncbi:MAG: 30S ribosomal protein S20 [Firmicutes bacterium]|nr:30S ribosomal protein S20 [Bacillota bacterium]